MLPLCKHGSSSRPLPQWLQPCQASKAKTTSTGTTMPSCHQLICRISSYELWILDPCSCKPTQSSKTGFARLEPCHASVVASKAAPICRARPSTSTSHQSLCQVCQNRVVPGRQNLQARKGPLELCSFGESVVDIDFLVSESHCYESVIFEVFRILYLSKTLVPCCWLVAQVGGK